MNKIYFAFFLLNVCKIMTFPVVVANGGTGIVSATAYAVLCGGTTATGPIQPLASAGTSGQALISSGAGALPAFGTLGFAGGGTGATSLSAGVIQSDGSVLSTLGIGLPNQLLFNSTGAAVGWAFTGILQMVYTSTSASVDTSGGSIIPDDNTPPQNTEGTEILTLSITPLSSSSSLWINFTTGGTPSVNTAAIIALFVDSTVNALAAQYMNKNASRGFAGSLDYIVASGSTSSRTYKIRIGGGSIKLNDSGAGQVFLGTATTTLTIIEFI